MTKLVDKTYARSGKYRKVLEQIEKDGVCPFCPENFGRYSAEPVLEESNHWYAAKNSYSYKESKLALIVVSKRHVEDLFELTSKEWEEGLQLVRALLLKFKVKGGGLALRFGDSKYTGSTVTKHLHFHLLVPKIKNRKAVVINFPIG